MNKNRFIKEDCFAYHVTARGLKTCIALKELHCAGCKFYKNINHYRLECEECNKINRSKGIRTREE